MSDPKKTLDIQDVTADAVPSRTQMWIPSQTEVQDITAVAIPSQTNAQHALKEDAQTPYDAQAPHASCASLDVVQTKEPLAYPKLLLDHDTLNDAPPQCPPNNKDAAQNARELLERNALVAAAARNASAVTDQGVTPISVTAFTLQALKSGPRIDFPALKPDPNQPQPKRSLFQVPAQKKQRHYEKTSAYLIQKFKRRRFYQIAFAATLAVGIPCAWVLAPFLSALVLTYILACFACLMAYGIKRCARLPHIFKQWIVQNALEARFESIQYASDSESKTTQPNRWRPCRKKNNQTPLPKSARSDIQRFGHAFDRIEIANRIYAKTPNAVFKYYDLTLAHHGLTTFCGQLLILKPQAPCALNFTLTPLLSPNDLNQAHPIQNQFSSPKDAELFHKYALTLDPNGASPAQLQSIHFPLFYRTLDAIESCMHAQCALCILEGLVFLQIETHDTPFEVEPNAYQNLKRTQRLIDADVDQLKNIIDAVLYACKNAQS